MFFHFIISIVYAQPTLEWARTYPDSNNIHGLAWKMALDDSLNVFVTGGNWTNTLGTFCTIKYSPAGVKQWVANYYYDTVIGGQALAIALDKSSNIYVTGIMHRGGNLYDYCTIKYNSSGIKQWVQYYDGYAHDDDQPRAIVIDNAGNIYVTGYSSTGGGHFDYVTIKYSASGAELWVQRYGFAAENTVATGIIADDNCNVYITGQNNNNSVTIKYDSSGTQLWVQTYIGISSLGAYATSIAIDKHNNVFVTGFS